MKAALVAASLAVVITASVLNLFLGGVWVAVLIGILVLRRRRPGVAGLVVVMTVAAGGGALWLGGLPPPPPTSYGASEWEWFRTGWSALAVQIGADREPDPLSARAAALRTRLEARRIEELAYSPAELTRRTASAVAASRTVGRLRARAPAEVAAVEDAVGRLALTLTAPEFRDLEHRRQRLVAHFAALETEFRNARDDAALDAISRALDPAVLASISFRPITADLARVDATMAALVRASSGSDVTVRATSRVSYDEDRLQLTVEDRYLVAASPPLRIRRLDVGRLRDLAVGRALDQRLAYGVGDAEPEEPVTGADVAVTPGAGRLVLSDRRVEPAMPVRVGGPLRPIAFHRVAVGRPVGREAELGVTVALDGGGAARALLTVRAAPRLEGVQLPHHAFHYASVPGTLTTGGSQDVWTPAEPERAVSGVTLELVPPTVLLRNSAFGRIKPYLYRPNLAAMLALTGLAALTATFLRRGRRTPPPPAR